ncbi:hypothetical protein [Sphingobacterium mizutaii]|uniref:hypothetical protein n=1 Tax=Sphingobacterium mizutaii TaxID=1010 RepID=UPI0016289012|nr:hypothetical protein [Sphingobacterium mizutaii]
MERKSDQTDEGAQGYQFSSLLLERKSNQKASAHLRWLFAPSIAQDNGILSLFPPLEMSQGLKDFLRKD